MVDREFHLLLPRWVREFPADLALVVGATALALLGAFLPGVRETPLRVVFGIPFVLFLPGYAFVSALFPESSESDSTGSDVGPGTTGASISGHERAVVAVGLSLTTVPMVVLTLNFTPYGTRFVPVLVGVSAVTLGLTTAAAIRRRRLPPEDRFRVPFERVSPSSVRGLLESETRLERWLNLVILLALLVGTGSAVYAVAVPEEGQSYTEFYVLAENESGELVASDFPAEFAVGEQQPVVVGVDNRENRRANYTVVVELQRLSTENGSARVAGAEELHRFQPVVADDETWRRQHALQPTMTGRNLRVEYRLYRGDAPRNTDPREPYRSVHFWVNVTAAED